MSPYSEMQGWLQYAIAPFLYLFFGLSPMLITTEVPFTPHGSIGLAAITNSPFHFKKQNQV